MQRKWLLDCFFLTLKINISKAEIIRTFFKLLNQFDCHNRFFLSVLVLKKELGVQII